MDERLRAAQARLNRLSFYPRPVRAEHVRVIVAPWLFRLPWFRRFDGYAAHATILLRREPRPEDEHLLVHELCHVWQMQHRPLRMPLSYLLVGYGRNPYELQARRAVELTRGARIAVFLHGTTIMHRGGIGRSRVERVAHVHAADRSVAEFASYVPIGGAAAKVRRWVEAGAEIVYLSSHRRRDFVAADEAVLRRHGFPRAPVAYRAPDESYADLALRVRPDVIVEDDCESIGGSSEMTHPALPEEARARIKCVVVREFEGIDHLPDDPALLVRR
jgi:hypothetical protein